jgi:hypothetical protein
MLYLSVNNNNNNYYYYYYYYLQVLMEFSCGLLFFPVYSEVARARETLFVKKRL